MSLRGKKEEKRYNKGQLKEDYVVECIVKEEEEEEKEEEEEEE